MQDGDRIEVSAVSVDDNTNCRERIAAIEGAEENLVSFLSSFGKLLENPGNPDTEVNKKLIVDCYTNLSDASIIFRRELKLLEQSLRVPPTLLKKDESATAKKLNSLLNKGH